jgi:dephospho-CoA kinase
MIIIGITGTLGAGKGTIVDYLVDQRQFVHYSVRAYLLEEIRRREMPENRDSMFNLANALRAEHGSSYVTDQLYLRALQSGSNCVIESIRTPGEVESLRQKGRFFLLAIDADPQLRYDRIRVRNSETDQVSFETFRENELRELTATDPTRQNLRRCIEMADFVIENNGSKEELICRTEEILGKIVN